MSVRNPLLCVALLLALLPAGCHLPRHDAERATDESPRAPIVVASDLDNMPFAGVDEAGRPMGREVDMMAALSAAVDRPIEWKRIPFDTLLPSVKAGFVDVACATIGVTPERGEDVSFTRPYFETVIKVVVRAGAGEPRSWDDMVGRRLAAAQGTTSERAVRLKLPSSELVLENKSGLGDAERLLSGDVDGIAMDGPAADAFVAASQGALTTLDLPLSAERYALAVSKSDPALLAALDSAIAEMQESGRMASLDVRYGLRPTESR
ncbi:MAG: amino acid ABC transporter substrate-binding protein [Planctomycetes bacterium]|nr:amino acid ABC transporter substrate-binding protein [Planctomycetota bacterium]